MPLVARIQTAGISVVSKGELIEVHGIGRLLVVAIFLVVDGEAVPAGRRSGIVVPVDCAGLSVERDGLKKQLVPGSSLHLKGQVVPGIAVGMAGNPGWNPGSMHIVPNIPLIAASYSAFMSPDEALTVEKLVDVKFHSLGKINVVCPEINVIREVVQRWNNSMVFIQHALRGSVADQVIVPETVAISLTATERIFGRFAAKRWRLDVLRHGEGNVLARRRRAIDEARSALACFTPATAMLELRERSASAATGDMNCDPSSRSASASVPFLDDRVVSSGV